MSNPERMWINIVYGKAEDYDFIVGQKSYFYYIIIKDKRFNSTELKLILNEKQFKALKEAILKTE